MVENWAVVGAPYAHKPTRAVQAITTSGVPRVVCRDCAWLRMAVHGCACVPPAAVTAFDNEVQVVTTSSGHLWEVQRIEIYPPPSANVTGTFSLGWGAQVSTRTLFADIFDAYIKVCVCLSEGVWFPVTCCVCLTAAVVPSARTHIRRLVVPSETDCARVCVCARLPGDD